MTQQVYKEMLDVMKQRWGPYTGVDIPEFIFQFRIRAAL